MTTDTKALAAAIEAFERELPSITWTVTVSPLSQESTASAMFDFEIISHVCRKTPAAALIDCQNEVRARYARRTARREYAADLTAEYGPEVVL